MQRCMLLAKIYRAGVSEACLDYEGSIAVPPEVVEATGLLAAERVLVANVTTGARFETYVIPGEKAAHFCLNGAAAHLGSPGDRIIVMAFAWLDEGEAARHTARVVVMDEHNRITRVTGGAGERRCTGIDRICRTDGGKANGERRPPISADSRR